ncbi:MAG TPA: tRNA preQ1(34) S-adenosylmethionine ribosyltransferase-isomerase QueA [Candidatus Acidoferrum sp.]|nr:tRNA preQ1(34) S-adenosylmethionine ribosyltransferase-isomerase QueA [Candidatus Acidoferrum sp.]
MKVSDFDFDLPPSLIADRPAVPRDSARLLEVADGLSDHIVRELPALLRPGDLLVFNDTRVIPARLYGRRGLAAVEVTLHKSAAADRWRAFARPGRRLRERDRIAFDGGLSATVAEKGEGGEIELVFDRGGADLMAALAQVGHMPLPPYIKRTGGADARDARDYQTIFAAKDGAVAAPTAGLHFTPELLAALAARGISRVAVTLHVGAGTFLPVKVEDTGNHVMHAEVGVIDGAAVEAVARTRAAGGRIVAVGTTSLRLLETAADEDGGIHPFSGDTNLFITPGYRFKAVDLLLTNFHLPRSTLFMLVAAFAGLERMKDAYEHAKAAGYRFYSYGDCCLLHPAVAQ